jgi:hypothetical protein
LVTAGGNGVGADGSGNLAAPESVQPHAAANSATTRYQLAIGAPLPRELNVGELCEDIVLWFITIYTVTRSSPRP